MTGSLQTPNVLNQKFVLGKVLPVGRARKSCKTSRRVKLAKMTTPVAEEKANGRVTTSSSGALKADVEHLIILVNGLFGHADNWKVVSRNLGKSELASKLLLLASKSNSGTATYQGIDKCGETLAKELKVCVEENPSLKFISVFGHSMGGLIARYAMGILYEPEDGTFLGLKPRHFISLAVPHLGVGGKGSAEVPFIRWTADTMVGAPLAYIMHLLSASVTATLFKRTGQQFFLKDGTAEKEPLLLRMVEDGPEGHFYSSLKSFASRTCLANSSGDHLVGWANASVRHVEELPDLGNVKTAKGIVRTDAVESAFWNVDPSNRNLKSLSEVTDCSPSSQEWIYEVAHSEACAGVQEQEPCRDTARKPSRGVEGRNQNSEAVLRILDKLQRLPWCRIDCSFKGTLFPFFSHNLIQVTREWVNWEGEEVTVRLAEHFASLEEVLGANAFPK